MKSPTHPPNWTYGQIKQAAEEILSDLHPSMSLPIPIEDIVELKLGIKLNTSVGLKSQFDIDGFIHTNFEEITLDDEMFNSYEERTRFTIGHELGHRYLHNKIYKQFTIEDENSYIEFQNSISEEDQKWLEIQANIFSACLLVPTNKLKEEVKKAIKVGNSNTPVQADYSIPYLEELPSVFNVSYGVIYRRLDKEKLLSES
jgi:Zn-dependent peptidase ImmA (M78 family)